MLFQSQFYVLVFLPATVAIYYVAARSLIARQWGLIAASLLFSPWWHAGYAVLPVAQITATWLLAYAPGRTAGPRFLVAGVLLNLASLGTCKYLDFALGTIEAVGGFALPRAHIVLP